MKTAQKLTIFEYELPIVIESNSDGYLAKCPSWSDCYAQGDSIEEVISEINSVATSLIELYQEENLKIPLSLKKKESVKSDLLKFNFPVFISGNYA